MKNREELQNSIFEKSTMIVKRRSQRRKREGVTAAGLFLIAGMGIYLLKNVSVKNHKAENKQIEI